MSLQELIERVEKATGADRELDRQIGLALCGWRCVESIAGYSGQGPFILVPDEDGGDTVEIFPDHPGSMYPAISASLDAVLQLVERKLPGWWWRVARVPYLAVPIHGVEPPSAQAEMGGKWALKAAVSEYGHTPALALLLALLRALQAQDHEVGR